MLCSTCQGIFEGQLLVRKAVSMSGDVTYLRDHHHETCALQRSAEQGCLVCARLWQLLERRGETTSPTLNLDMCGISLTEITSGSLNSLLFRYRLRNGELLYEHFMIWPKSRIHPEILQVMLNQRHEDRTDSRTTMNLVTSWFKECMANHSDCNTDGVNTAMPTRLLELRSPSPDHVRLLITPQDGEKFPYMTLSHCWGAARFIKLTEDTMPQLLNGIHLDLLPKSFRDATAIAQKLGVRYLWIDSLCIQQDSREDWQREASTMGDVYKGALCNISAAGSPDSSGGCFYTRNPRVVEACFFTSSFTDYSNDQYHIRLLDYLQGGLRDDQPLFTRGWIVQERALPPRVVHFGKTQVFWECKTANICETYPMGITVARQETPYDQAHNSDYLSSLKTWDFATNPSNQEDRQMRIERMYGVWGILVEVYSQCRLTRAEDKLIAIAGLAKEMYKAVGGADEYLAGLWRRHILYQLLWYRNGRLAGTRPEQYRAPSWSWASIDGTIELDYPAPGVGMDVIFDITFINAHVELLSGDPFAQVIGGFIRLCGPLMTIIIKRTDKDIRSRASAYYALINGEQTEGRVYPEMDVGDTIVSSLHFMPFCSNGSESSQFVGLLLQPTGASRGQFRRCGRLTMYKQAVRVAGGPSWVGIKNHDWLEYETFDGKSRYTISIV